MPPFTVTLSQPADVFRVDWLSEYGPLSATYDLVEYEGRPSPYCDVRVYQWVRGGYVAAEPRRFSDEPCRGDLLEAFHLARDGRAGLLVRVPCPVCGAIGDVPHADQVEVECAACLAPLVTRLKLDGVDLVVQAESEAA